MIQREAFAEMPQKNQFWFHKEYFTEINLLFYFLVRREKKEKSEEAFSTIKSPLWNEKDNNNNNFLYIKIQ